MNESKRILELTNLLNEASTPALTMEKLWNDFSKQVWKAGLIIDSKVTSVVIKDKKTGKEVWSL